MVDITYTDAALFDLDRILINYSRHTQAGADSFIGELSDTFQLMAEMPHMGRARDDLMPSVRTHVYRAYVIFYSIVNEGIVIERIASPGQNTEDFFE